MEDNFEKLEELVNDDGKIVTVPYFAVVASISLADSQEIFNKYVEVNHGFNIYSTFIICGARKDREKFSVMQVNNDDLENEKQKYKDPFSVSIYSIQKAPQVDYRIMSLVEPNEYSEKLMGEIITGKTCNKRVLRKNILPSIPAPTIKGKSTMFMKQKSTSVKSEENIKSNEKMQAGAKSKVGTHNSITNMFNKATQKKGDNKTEKVNSTNANKNGGLTNFFTKKSTNSQENVKSINIGNGETENGSKEIKSTNSSFQSNAIRKANKSNDLFDSDTDEEILKDLNINNEKPVESKPEKNPMKSSQKKNKRRGKDDRENDKSAKKRKRIIVEDSDSDDIFGSEKSGDEPEISDKEEVPIKEEPKQLPPKNKRRKAVKKTYEDEEGFIVTQTEYVYETASEDENEHAHKITKNQEPEKPKFEKKSSNGSEREISPKAKNKKGAKKTPQNQPTLMNFFKKK